MMTCYRVILIFAYISAQQDAQRAQYIVERAKQDRLQKIVQAEGEAQIAKTISFVFNVISNWFPCPLISDTGVFKL